MRHLVFRGVKHVDERELRRKLATEQSPAYGWASKQYYDPFVLALDTGRIESYYRAHGFFDARVRATDVVPGARANSVDITIDVDEGVATRIAEVRLPGLDTLGDAALPVVRNLDLKKGQIFNYDLYLAEKSEAHERLRTLGYVWAEVQGEVRVDRERHLCAVTLTFEPGLRATIGYVDVEGSHKLEPRLLVRHALLREGQLLTSDAIETARARLYNLGMFSAVRIGYEHDALRSEHAVVRVDVKEAPSNEWRIGAGISFEAQRTEVRGRVLYARAPFLRGLRRLRLRFEPAYVAFPAFWNPIRQGPAATVEAELTQFDPIYAPDELRASLGYDLGLEYAFQYHGPRGQIGYTRNFLRDRLQLGVSYNFQFFLFFNTDPALLVDPAVSARVYGYVNPYRLGWLYQQVVYDLRDQPFDTRRGAWFSLRAEEGGVYAGGAFTYEKIEAEVRAYYSLSRLTLAARTMFGHIFSHGDYGSPSTRRFYLGGQDTHRGFNFNRLSLQIPSGVAGSPSVPIGGDEMFLTQLELRVRTVKLFGSWLELAGFVDAGDVSAPTGRPHDHIDLGQLHVATGFGLRYKSIIGTVRLDFGFRLNRLSPNEPDGRQNPDPGQPFAFHISIGEPF